MARHHRLASKEFLVYTGDTTFGWRIIRATSFVKGEALVDQGVYIRLYDALTGQHLGYGVRESRGPVAELNSSHTSPALTRFDSEAIAGLYGKSKTIGMSEELRLLRRCPRTGKQLAPEDFIERAIARAKEYRLPPSPPRVEERKRIEAKAH